MQFTKRVAPPASKSPAAAKQPSHAAIVQQGLERLRKGRAAAQPLRAAFPAVTQLQIELSFQGSSASSPASQRHVLFPPAAAFFEFRCPYADCDGKFDLSDAVAAALRHPAHCAQGALHCEGHRGPSAADDRCPLRLDYVVTAECRRVA